MVHAEHRFPEELLDQVNAIVWKSTPASKNPCLRSGKGRNACGKKKEPGVSGVPGVLEPGTWNFGLNITASTFLAVAP